MSDKTRAILVFTRKGDLHRIGFTHNLIPELNEKQLDATYISDNGDIVILMYDGVNYDKFLQYWEKVEYQFDKFAYVFHNLPVNEIKDFLDKKNPIKAERGRHQKYDVLSEVYLAFKPVVENYTQDSTGDSECSQKDFDKIWDKYFKEPSLQSEKLALIHKIFSGQNFSNLNDNVPDSYQDIFDKFKDQIQSDSFDINNSGHVDALTTFRNELKLESS